MPQTPNPSPNARFRFESLDIWKIAIEIGDELFDISDELENKKLFRFAEQLRGAGMSISNNIAEGSGSVSNKEFHQFLNFAHRSCFECANILVIIQKRRYISPETKDELFGHLELLAKKITSFQKSLFRQGV